MSSEKGNVKKTGPPKYQNKKGYKNLYHDTSIQTKRIINTEVAGVCKRCKDVIDWKIKYKKYKPLSQAKTCADCKNKTVRHAYHVFCQSCGEAQKKCTKCGEKKEIVQQPSLSDAALASQDSELQFELDQMPERKRRTFMRLQEKGMLTKESLAGLQAGDGEDGDSDDEQDNDDTDTDNDEPGTDHAPSESPEAAGSMASVVEGEDASETQCPSETNTLIDMKAVETNTVTDMKTDDTELSAHTAKLNISSKVKAES